MKKGLLSLLVVALTVVGCQDYDDQFDDLNKELLSLKTSLSSLSGITNAITTLTAEVTALKAVDVVDDTEFLSLLAKVATVQSAVDAFEAADVSGIETEVADLNSEIAQILEQLVALNKAGSSYQGDLTIRSLAELGIAEDNLGIDPTATELSTSASLANVTGNVLITADATDLAPAAIQARLDAVISRIKTVAGSATITGIDAALSAAELTFVGGTAEFEGTNTIGLPKLSNVIGRVHFDLAGALDFQVLASTTSVVISTNSSVTTVNLVGLLTGEVSTGTGVLILPDATSVILYSAPASVTLASAETVQIHNVAANAGLDLAAPSATSVVVLAASITGAVTITANAATVDLSSANLGGGTISAATINADTATTASATTLSATTISLAALTTIGTGGLNYHGPLSFSSATLATQTGAFVSNSATAFTAAAFTQSLTLDLKDGAVDISILSITDTNTISEYATIANLTLAGQLGTLDVLPLVAMVTLGYTGDAGAGVYANDLAITTANASLTTVVLGSTNELESLTVTGTALTSLSTAGVILDLDVTNNAALETLSFGHTHLDGQDATTVNIVGNTDPAFVAVDMSTLSKAKTVVITGNTSLTAITPPSAAVLAEPTAAIALTVSNNLLQGTYTAAVVGTDTTPAAAHEATSTVITAFKALIDAYDAQAARTATATYDLGIDQVDTTGTAGDADALFNNGTFAAQAGTTGDIDTPAELALF